MNTPNVLPGYVARTPRPRPTDAEQWSYTVRHVARCIRETAGNREGAWLSTGERLTGALYHGKFAILEEMGYTVREALQRIGTEWIAVLVSDDLVRELDQ